MDYLDGKHINHSIFSEEYIEKILSEIYKKGFIIKYDINFCEITINNFIESQCDIYILIDESKYIMQKLAFCFDIEDELNDKMYFSGYRLKTEIKFV
jgi:protocatechuate 3,4-dioxygenase beta subunit